jgi:hypothetical protein
MRWPYDRTVAYDEELADRIRVLVAGEADLNEQEMFGGSPFSSRATWPWKEAARGGILVRVDPAQSDALVAVSAIPEG